MHDNQSTDRSLRPGVDVGVLRQRYVDDGFCVIPQLFPSNIVAEGIVAAEAVASGKTDTGLMPRTLERDAGDEPQRLVKIAEPHRASHALRRLIASSRPWQAIAAVTGARMLQIWAVDLFIKRPGSTAQANIGWHQDGPYAPYWKGDIFTVWVALSDVAADGSSLRYLRGSHRLGPVGKHDLFRTDLDLASPGLALPEGLDWTVVSTEMAAGGIAMHHRHTFHASGPNLSSRSRVSLALRVRTDRCQLVDDAVQVAHLHDQELAPVVYDKCSDTNEAPSPSGLPR